MSTVQHCLHPCSFRVYLSSLLNLKLTSVTLLTVSTVSIPAWVIGKVLIMLKDQQSKEDLNNQDDENVDSNLELSENGLQKKLRHRSGVVSMSNPKAENGMFME